MSSPTAIDMAEVAVSGTASVSLQLHLYLFSRYVYSEYIREY